MMEITQEQALNHIIYGTCIIMTMVLCLILIVIFFNNQQMKWNKELEELFKSKRAPFINTEDEFLMISGGRKIKNRHWKGNNLNDVHQMD